MNVKRKESKKDVGSRINISMDIQSVDQSFDIVHIDRKNNRNFPIKIVVLIFFFIKHFNAVTEKLSSIQQSV